MAKYTKSSSLEKPLQTNPQYVCEAKVLEAIALEEGLVQQFLICGVAYNALDHPLITDETWDKLCKALDAAWEEQDHRHKHLIERESLRTSTAQYLTEGYVPGIVWSIANRWKHDPAWRTEGPSNTLV